VGFWGEELMLAYLAAMSVTAGLYALMALGVNLTWA